MLDNMSVKLPGGNENADEREKLRVRLLDVTGEPGDTENEGLGESFRLADIRASFFLWQGGNQFEGPSTTIRSEPGAKEELDYDAQYFHNLKRGDYEKLIAEGEKVVAGGQEEGARVETLKNILAITKDVTPKQPDWNKFMEWSPIDWVEITSRAEVERLAKNAKLARPHILKYTYFKMEQNQMGSGKKYSDLIEVMGSGGQYKYMDADGESSADLGTLVQKKGTWAYISYTASKDPSYTPKSTKAPVEAKLIDVLNRLQPEVGLTDTGKEYVITTPHDKLVLGNKVGTFQVKGYIGDIPYRRGDKEGEWVVAKGLGNKKLKEEAQAQAQAPKRSLYQYCVEKRMPVTTWLPRDLYRSVQDNPFEFSLPLSLPTHVGLPFFGVIPLPGMEQEKLNS